MDNSERERLEHKTDQQRLQHNALKRCEDPGPIPADEGRKMLARFVVEGGTYFQSEEVNSLIARVSLDQSVRLQESNERLSNRLIYLTLVLIALTVALIVVGVLPLFKHG
jgi:hypothetical protein